MFTIVSLLCVSLFLTYNHARYSWQHICQIEGGILLCFYQTIHVCSQNRFLGHRLTSLLSAVVFPRRHVRGHNFLTKQFHTTHSCGGFVPSFERLQGHMQNGRKKSEGIIALEGLGDAGVYALLRLTVMLEKTKCLCTSLLLISLL